MDEMLSKLRLDEMLSKLKPIFKQKKYFSIFVKTSVISIASFLLLTLIMPWSRFLLFNYFLKEAITPTVLTFIIIVSFSLTLGFITSFVAYNFKAIIGNKLTTLYAIIGVFYIVSFVLMLGNTSYSLFSYTEMSGFLFTFFNMVLLAPILALSSLLILNIYTTVKNFDSSATGVGGLGAGIFSLGCPACGSLVLSLVGVSAGLSVFPFKGSELKLLSLGLLVFATSKLNAKACKAPVGKTSALSSKSHEISATKISRVKTKPFVSEKFESIMLAVMLLTAGLVLFNQMQISSISSSLGAGGTASFGTGLFSDGGSSDLSSADISEVSSTAMALATVFPDLKNANNDQDVMNIMFSSGIPEYSEALGGITFDDPETSLNYLAKWYYSLKEDVKQNDPETWQRYINLAAAPRGISCEFCCGVGPQGIDAQGNLKCGCQHNPAAQAITLGLMEYTDYSDAEVLREVMKWKTIFFPQKMISLGVEVSGQDPSQLKNLPGMVGGC